MKAPILIKFNKKKISKKVRNKRFDIITMIIVALAVLLSILATCYTAFKMYEIRNGKNIGNIDNVIKRENDIFNIESYYAQIEATIVSNKNINTYNIKQYYIKKDNTNMQRVEFKDSLENVVTSIYNGKDLKVSSNNQNFKYLVQEYNISNMNYLDIYAVIEKYKSIKNGELKGQIENFEKDDEIRIIIKYDKDDCWYNDKIKISELIINKKNQNILNLVHYDDNKKVICNIKYNEFKINQKIELSLFNF